MLLYGTSTSVQVCVVSITVGNAFLDFLKAGFGQLQRRVLVTPDVVLISIKCIVEYFPRFTCRIHPWSWLHCVDMNSLNSVGCITLVCVGVPGEAELNCDFTTQHKAAGEDPWTLFVEEGAGFIKYKVHLSYS